MFKFLGLTIARIKIKYPKVFFLNISESPPSGKHDLLSSWMKEEKGIRHRGEGANLRCPVSTSVQFSLRDEGSSENICVCEGRESLMPNF